MGYKGIKILTGMKNDNQLIEFLADRGNGLSPLLILMHDYPDPDSMASALALSYLCREKFQIKTKIVYGGIISSLDNRDMVRELKIPAHKLKISDLSRYRNVALVDTQPAFENNSFPKDRKAAIIIDQHIPVSAPQADLSLIDEKRGATCEILAEAIISLNNEIPENLATALAYGILTDTMNLSAVHSRKTFDIYGTIFGFCNIKTLSSLQNTKRPALFFFNMRKTIDEAQICGRLIFCHLENIEDPVYTAHSANFLLTYKKADWALCTGRYNGRLYVSLRSIKQDVSAGDILRSIFPKNVLAGGHGNIAGGSIELGDAISEDEWKNREDGMASRLIKKLRIKSSRGITSAFQGGSALAPIKNRRGDDEEK